MFDGILEKSNRYKFIKLKLFKKYILCLLRRFVADFKKIKSKITAIYNDIL